jgi:hypothetical protein
LISFACLQMARVTLYLAVAACLAASAAGEAMLQPLVHGCCLPRAVLCQKRHLTSCRACACVPPTHFAAQLPALSTAGAPPFLKGPFYETNNDPGSVTAVGWIKDGKFSSTYPANSTAGGYVTVMGEYTSWQCGSENGTYQAIVNRTTIQPNGTSEQRGCSLQRSATCDSALYLESTKRSGCTLSALLSPEPGPGCRLRCVQGRSS